MRFLLLAALFVVAACGQRRMSNAPDPEPPYCDVASIPTPKYPVKVTGRAEFRPRLSTSMGLLGELDTGIPIRYSEVRILNAKKEMIACGETDKNGAFALNVPAHGSYTVKVQSRSENAHVQVSVLRSPSQPLPYALKETFNVETEPLSLPVMIAHVANPEVLSGAFNIQFNILRANESLRYLLCGKDADTSCSAFSEAPKVTIYWTAGVNPSTYFGGKKPMSFYEATTDALFILGGSAGDVDHSDTDQFDDGIITHEYGHFIEAKYGRSDSPGGTHDGNSVNDPRLAWSEGWANYFSALVRGTTNLRDTYGDVDGVTGCSLDYDVEANESLGHGATDVASIFGEGNFRELAITRALFDLEDPFQITAGGPIIGGNGGPTDDNAHDTSTGDFRAVWNAFRQFAQPDLHFRNVGLLLRLIHDRSIAQSSAVMFQGLEDGEETYGDSLVVKSSNCPIMINANDPPSYPLGSLHPKCVQGNLNPFCSNQFESNHFYDIAFDGRNVRSIQLNRVSGEADLDLFLYRDGYTFGRQADIVMSDITPGTAIKRLNLQGQPPGHYMLNVNVFTGNGNPRPTQYQLYLNGQPACPESP